MRAEQQRLTAAERANLVAYLDQELNEVEAQAIATKLTQSPVVRRELESLRRTWDLLESLPRPQAPADFTTRTIAEVEGLRHAADQGLNRLRQIAILVLRGGIAAVLAGVAFTGAYAAARWAWPDPTAQLARDLSLAEHLNEYRDVGSFEFLERLDELPAFKRLEASRAGGAP